MLVLDEVVGAAGWLDMEFMVTPSAGFAGEELESENEQEDHSEGGQRIEDNFADQVMLNECSGINGQIKAKRYGDSDEK